MVSHELDYTFKSQSTMPFGFKHRVVLIANDNAVSTRYPGASLSEQGDLVPYTHPNMRVPSYDEKYWIFGIARAYNKTTGVDVTPKVKKVTDSSGVAQIIFHSNYVSDGDLIEVTYYTSWRDIKADPTMATSGASLDKIEQAWLEQLFRFASQLDRTDYGKYAPDMRHALDVSGTGHDITDYRIQPRLFFAHHGYLHEHSRYAGVPSSGKPLTVAPQKVIDWSIEGPHGVGGFIGDPTFTEVYGGNENFSVVPLPFYLTNIVFLCYQKNGGYSTDTSSVIKLNFNIDGQPHAFTTAPFYEEGTLRPIANRFGEENDLYLGFSGGVSYEGLGPAFSTGEQMGETPAHMNIARKSFDGVRVNQSVTINASIVGDGLDELTPWYLVIGGWILRSEEST